MPEPVREDVVDCVLHFANGTQDVHVEPFGKYLSAAAESAVEGLGDPDGEPLDASRERGAIVGLRDEVEVVALHREVHDAKVVPLAGRLESRQHGAMTLAAAQALESGHEPQGHVNGMVRRKRWTAQMWHGARSVAWAAGALPRTAASFVTKIESQLSESLH